MRSAWFASAPIARCCRWPCVVLSRRANSWACQTPLAAARSESSVHVAAAYASLSTEAGSLCDGAPIVLGLNRAHLIPDPFVPAKHCRFCIFRLSLLQKGDQPRGVVVCVQLTVSCQLVREWHQLTGFVAYLMQT